MTVHRMHRILMTTDTVGGVFVYAMALARRLAQTGIQVTLVTLGPAPRANQLDAVNAIGPNLDLVVTDLALEWHDPEGHDVARAASALLRIANKADPDLVHLNGFREGALPWPCPALVVAHSCVWSWWRAARGEWPSEARWSIYRDAVAAGLDAADAWAAPTAAFRDLIQSLYQPATAGWVIPNGIDIAPPPLRKEPVVLGSGRVWDAGKNLLALANAAAGLPWRVEIAGAGMPSETGAAMPNVHWLGELDHELLQGHMRRASIYAAPAHYEPFGLGVLEAAAAGCALILSDIDSFRELWDGAALFVPADDAARLRGALIQACGDDLLRTRLQRAALARAQRYSLDRTFSHYLDLYGVLQELPLSSRVIGQEAQA